MKKGDITIMTKKSESDWDENENLVCLSDSLWGEVVLKKNRKLPEPEVPWMRDEKQE